MRAFSQFYAEKRQDDAHCMQPGSRRHGMAIVMGTVLTNLEEPAFWAEDGDMPVIPSTATSRHVAGSGITASEMEDR